MQIALTLRFTFGHVVPTADYVVARPVSVKDVGKISEHNPMIVNIQSLSTRGRIIRVLADLGIRCVASFSVPKDFVADRAEVVDAAIVTGPDAIEILGPA